MLFSKGDPYRVKLDLFEGPLDLLLYLTKKNELDICEVSLNKIADQYLDFIQTMEMLDLEIAGEFILVAATLMLIKSRALLPQESQFYEDGEDDYETPQELVKRLLEYKKYKEAAVNLKDKNVLFKSVFIRPGTNDEWVKKDQSLANLDVDLVDLLEALKRVLENVPKTTPMHWVESERISLGFRLKQIYDLLSNKKEILFTDLFADQKTRYLVIVTFLALLEMAKVNVVRLYQSGLEATIHIQSRMDEGVDLSRLEMLIETEKNNVNHGGGLPHANG